MEPVSLRSPDVAEIASAGGIALQPIGATEQHGPHLPLTTDAIIAEALTALASAKLPATLPAWTLPVLSYGKSLEHVGRPGTVSLTTSTLIAVCMDIGRAVAASGIRTLVFVNAHGGNPEVLQLVARDIKADCGVDAYSVNAPSLPGADRAGMPRADLDVHGGYYETSVMLALAAERVDLGSAHADGLAVAEHLARQRRISLFGDIPLPWHIDDLSASGIIGDPTGATAEWGRSALEAQAIALSEAIVELAAWRYPAIGTGE